MKKDSFCPAPFMGAYVNGDKASPCCWYDRKTLNKNINSSTTIEDVFNGNTFTEIRNRMLSGEVIPECSRCDKHDHSKEQSHRDLWKKRAADLNLSISSNEDRSLHSLDLFLGNECNLACLMCSSYNSHKWIEDEKAIFNKSFSSKLENLNINDYSFLNDVKRLKLAGGEVLLMQEHKNIINYLINNKLAYDIELVYVTNGTVPHLYFQKEWSEFKSIQFIFSVDGINNVYNAIRWPAKWSETSTKIEDYIKCDEKYSFTLNCVVSALNILDVPDIQKWWSELTDSHATYRIIDEPSYLQLSSLTDSQRLVAIEKLDGSPHFSHIVNELKQINYLNENLLELNHFLGKISDQRNFDFTNLSPTVTFT